MEKLLEAPLRAAVSFLEEHSYRYAITGGVALAHWGVIRVTRDVDIKVLVPETDYAAMQKAIRAAFPVRARQHAPQNPLIVAVYIQNVVVDFLLAIPGYEELLIQRAVRRDLNGFSAWISTAEDLIIQKIYAGRDRDWPDVEALLIAQRGNLDKAYIENWLGQFAEALEKPEILVEFGKLVDRIDALGGG